MSESWRKTGYLDDNGQLLVDSSDKVFAGEVTFERLDELFGESNDVDFERAKQLFTDQHSNGDWTDLDGLTYLDDDKVERPLREFFDGTDGRAVAKPDGWTWHHHQDTGRIQLVRTDIHKAVGHAGGSSIWGANAWLRRLKAALGQG